EPVNLKSCETSSRDVDVGESSLVLHALDWDYVEQARGSNKHRRAAGTALPASSRAWAWSHSAIAVGAGQPATPRNRLRWGDRFSRLGHPTGPHALGARSTIDEVRDRLRIMGGLPEVRTPGAQTGR